MPSHLENPFRPPIPTVVDHEKEAHAIGLLLGPKAEAAYRKRHAHDLSDPSASVSSGLTAEEQAQMNEKPESLLTPERREQIREEWGKFFADAKLENAKQLMDSMEIHDDGSVSLTGDMNLDQYVDNPPKFPTKIQEYIGIFRLNGLESARGLSLPNIVEGNLCLAGLKSAEHLILPETVGSLVLSKLESAQHLRLPRRISGNLFLDLLESAEYLVLPTTIGGMINLRGLKSAKYLILPTHAYAGINLNGLASAEYLKLPRVINGILGLRGLISADHLLFPKLISGKIFLDRLTSEMRDTLRKRRPDLAEQIEPNP